MIRNFRDLCFEVESPLDTEASVAHTLYKNTVCGIVFACLPTGEGVEVSAYVEGMDGDLPAHRLLYPFTAGEFWRAVEVADSDAGELWRWSHTEVGPVYVAILNSDYGSTVSAHSTESGASARCAQLALAVADTRWDDEDLAKLKGYTNHKELIKFFNEVESGISYSRTLHVHELVLDGPATP